MTNQNEPEMGREIKRRFQLWLKPSVLQLAEEWYPKDDCGSKSEFIEKAILFYAGYLASEGSQNFIAKNIISTLRGMVSETENRISRMLFKLTVELAMTMNIIAATHNIKRSQLDDLRATCVSEVKRTNGTYSLKDALDMQKR